MGAKLDLKNCRFGKLVAIRPTNERFKRQVVWECKCDCGNTVLVPSGALRGGYKKSCGCLKSTSNRLIDEVGHKYGKLTVIKRSEGPAEGKAYWECKCDCGNMRIVQGIDLRSGKVFQCHDCALRNRIVKRNENGVHYPPPKDLRNQHFGKLSPLEPLEERQGGKRVIWKCLCECGNISYVAAGNLVSGNTTSCGLCGVRSIGEEEIKDVLLKNNISFQQQFTFDDLPRLRYDFAILDDRQIPIRLIEFDGIQHKRPIEYFGGQEAFEATQKRDMKKNEYAHNHRIPLVRIPYSKKGQITLELLLGDEYLVTVL